MRMAQMVVKIVSEVGSEYGVTPDEIISQDRRTYIVRARRAAMRRVRLELKLSYPVIGSYFNRDHTTVIHACKGLPPIDHSALPLTG